MVIYEVNLSVDNAIYPKFHSWLKEHVNEMLQFPGFINANILKPEREAEADKEFITVQYKLGTRNDLEEYFTKYASEMREKGKSLFSDKFSAERKIYEVQESFVK